jgi:hypothetical protein
MWWSVLNGCCVGVEGERVIEERGGEEGEGMLTMVQRFTPYLTSRSLVIGAEICVMWCL